jgi:hypothetical protein
VASKADAQRIMEEAYARAQYDARHGVTVDDGELRKMADWVHSELESRSVMDDEAGARRFDGGPIVLLRELADGIVDDDLRLTKVRRGVMALLEAEGRIFKTAARSPVIWLDEPKVDAAEPRRKRPAERRKPAARRTERKREPAAAAAPARPNPADWLGTSWEVCAIRLTSDGTTELTFRSPDGDRELTVSV